MGVGAQGGCNPGVFCWVVRMKCESISTSATNLPAASVTNLPSVSATNLPAASATNLPVNINYDRCIPPPCERRNVRFEPVHSNYQSRPPCTEATLPTYALNDILRRQSEISTSMNICQERASLPKKELQVFDGSDITKFHSFIVNFERIIEPHCSNDGERLIYLEQYTSGKPKKLVKSCTHYDSTVGYAKAKQLLFNEYNNEFKISNAYLDKIERWPIIKSEDADELQDFYIYLMECDHYLQNVHYTSQLQNPKELSRIASKLPFKLRERWRRKAHDILQSYRSVTLHDLVAFISNEVSVMKEPVFGSIAGDSKKFPLKNKALATVTTTKCQKTSKYCSFCEGVDHYLSQCKVFNSKSSAEKSLFVRKSGLCFGCLRRGHTSRTCKNKLTCSVCHLKHPTVLHDPQRSSKKAAEVTSKSEKSTTGCEATVCSTRAKYSKTNVKVLPPILPCKIRLDGFEKEVPINVALDTCSLDCWINFELLHKLGVKCATKNIEMTTMEGKNSVLVNVLSNVHLISIDGNNKINIPVVYSKLNSVWPFTADDIPSVTDVDDSLSKVPFQFLDCNVDMLLALMFLSYLSSMI